MEDDWNKNVMSNFIKIGIIVLTAIGVFALGINYMPGAVSVTSNPTKKLPIYCVKTDKPQVSISFDAAWGNEQTQTLLDILKEKNVKSTFFLVGQWVDKYPDSVKAIAADGHDIGN